MSLLDKQKIIKNEVDLNYSAEGVSNKLTAHLLETKQQLSQISVNKQKLAQIIAENPLAESHVQALIDFLSSWHAPESTEEFTTQINNLCYMWLNAQLAEIPAQLLLRLICCLELKTIFRDHTSLLHGVLFECLTEYSQRYHQAQLNYLQNYDANTTLPRALQTSYLITAQSIANIGLMCIQFQPVKHNLIFSNEETLRLNQNIAQILEKNISEEITLLYGGNLQFDLLVKHADASDINIIAAKLARAFEEMIFWGSKSILVKPYIGAYCGSTSNPENCIANAKLALESAVSGQHYLVMYSQQLQAQIDAQSHLETEVLNAFARDNLTLYMQPIVDIKHHRCVGAELLLRAPSLLSYHVYPSHTIEILNKVGKGKLFTRWLINSACRIASELNNKQGLNIYLTLNLRAEDLYDFELPLLLSQAIALWKITPSKILLEITENGILELNEASQGVINTLNQMGFKLALDDFGTGFSSLSRLRTMPIDLVKIDQLFVKNIVNSVEDYKVVESIATLAYNLGKDVLVEGVEDEASLNLIKKINIHKCQGYYFARPMTFEDFLAWNQAFSSQTQAEAESLN